jgi:hypothetical protein
MAMDVLIPTYGRPQQDRQHTLRALRAEGVLPVLVVQHREHTQYAWYDGPVHVLPPHIKTVAPTRDYLIHNDVWKERFVVMLDDDLHFFARRVDEPTKFRALVPGELRRMLDQIEGRLDLYPHVGIAPREGGNRNTEQVLRNTRIMRVLGYDRHYLRTHNITFAPMPVMEDFHVSLQILKSGKDTLVLNNWCNNQAEGSDAPGGCSSYRTMALQAEAARLLADLHKPYVSVVEKETKTAWGGGTRTDVVVYWKKARQHAASNA